MSASVTEVVVTSFAATVDQRFVRTLEDAGAVVTLAPGLGKNSSAEDIIERVRSATAIIAGTEPYPRETLTQLPRLRAIVRAGAGTDGIDTAAAAARGIYVSATPGANAESVADYALALMLASARRIPGNVAAVRGGGWRTPEQGVDLHGKSVGIVGYGAIGRAVARRLTGFECALAAYDPFLPHGPGAHGAELMPLEEVLRRSDFLTIHAPLTPETAGLIGEHELGLLPEGAIVVNAARGGVVDERALRDAVDVGHVSAAATDVFISEPVSADNPLLGHDRLLTTAHVAAFSADGADAMLRRAATDLLPYLSTEGTHA